MPLVSKAFGDIITFTRASGATWFNATGTLQGVDFSSTSNTIGTGTQTFTLDATAGVNRYWAAGDTVLISDQANSANNMAGTVSSYTAATQVLVVNVTSVGGSGTISSWRIGSTMPRFDYDPSTLAAQGLLIEEARTNLLLQSGWAGAVGGSPGTAPTSWTIGFGTGADTTLVNSIYGTAEQAIKFDADATERIMYQQAFSVTSGVQYAASVYIEAVSGVIGDAITVTNGTGTATQNTFVTSPSMPGRYTILFTATSTGTVNIRYGIGTTAGAAGTCSVTMSRPQVEAGAFATSYIPTTTTALTRSADVASVNTLSPWYNQTEGGLYVEWQSTPTLYARYLVSIEQAGTSATRIDININSVNAVNPRTVVSGAAVASLTAGTYTGGGIAKIAFGYKSADYASSFNGAAAVTATTAGALPSSLAIMYLGSITGGTQVNGWLRRLTFYPRRPSNAELVALST